MDALSEVLKSIRVEGAVYLNGEFRAPWCIRGECNVPGVRRRLEDADHVFFFHLLTHGACKARLTEGGKELHAVAGDVILIPGDDRHLLGSDLAMEPIDNDRLFMNASDPELVQLRYDGGGDTTRFVCGYLACSRSVCRPLLESLPRIACIPVGHSPGAEAIPQLLQAGVRESTARDPGAQSMLAKLSELMFVQAMRRYAESLPADRRGWFAAVRDPHVGRALSLLHRDPGHAWTVEELARGVALSRSALAERFAQLVGEAPMQYLTRWRLALAAQALLAGDLPIVRVAEQSGYESEAAFSRAFKREFGKPPATWRRNRGR